MGVTVNLQLSLSDAIVTDAMVSRDLRKMYATRSVYQDDADPVPDWLEDSIQEKERIHRELDIAIFNGQRSYFSWTDESDTAKESDNPVKRPPVDRGKLLIGLECCRDTECDRCPYDSETLENCNQVAFDALAYIGYLEKQLEEAGLE